MTKKMCRFWHIFFVIINATQGDNDMKISIYSRKEIEKLIESDFPKNTAVISFYDPVGIHSDNMAPVDYRGKAEIDNKLLNEFYNNEKGTVYSYYILHYESPYTHYGKKEYAQYDDMLKDIEKYIKNCETEIFRLIINKEYKNKSVLEMELNTSFEVKDIGGYYEDRDAIFDDLWFPIPTPFKQGDIVWFSKGVDREPYVVTFEKKRHLSQQELITFLHIDKFPIAAEKLNSDLFIGTWI